jgi:hypothetical protein
VVAGVGVVLLLAHPWLERRRVSRQLVDDVVAVSALPFERPSHRGRPGPEASVIECLKGSLPDGGFPRAPLGFTNALQDGGATVDGGSTWLEQHASQAGVVRRCLEAPRVGNFEEFGCLAGPSFATLPGSMAWLHGGAVGAVDGGAALEACLDAAALERDAPMLGGLLGAMLSGLSARSTTEPCLRALSRASPEARRAAAEVLSRLAEGQATFSNVLRLERSTATVSIFGGALAASDVARLPMTARACVGSLSGADASDRLKMWLLLPSYGQKMAYLIERSKTDPLLESAAVRGVLADQSPMERLVGDDAIPTWPGFARRFANIERKLAALRTLVEVLDGREVTPPPWLKVSRAEGSLRIAVEFDDGWADYELGPLEER